MPRFWRTSRILKFLPSRAMIYAADCHRYLKG
nr:MAG TPA: hypothetical protein [Caudoviricetes sp.]